MAKYLRSIFKIDWTIEFYYPVFPKTFNALRMTASLNTPITNNLALKLILPAMTSHNFHNKCSLVGVGCGCNGVNSFDDPVQGRIRTDLQGYTTKVFEPNSLFKVVKRTVMSVPQKSLSIEPTIPTMFRWLNLTAWSSVISPRRWTNTMRKEN